MPTVGSLQISASVAETLTLPENRSGIIFDIIRQSYDYTNGGAAGQNNLVWSDRRNVAIGGTDIIDLNGGGLTDAFGNAVNFLNVTGIVIFNRNATVGDNINFGPGLAQPFLWTFLVAGVFIQIPAGGCYCQWDDAGRAVVAGASDQIRIVNASLVSAIDYDILIIGRS
jgi:hypothetical protein